MFDVAVFWGGSAYICAELMRLVLLDEVLFDTSRAAVHTQQWRVAEAASDDQERWYAATSRDQRIRRGG